jgi:DNA-binding CsgD family transcriptional regulator
MCGLTPREKEVLKYMCLGYSNTEIAEKLIVSIHTAKAHVQHILEKYNVKNRTHLAYLIGSGKSLFYDKFGHYN